MTVAVSPARATTVSFEAVMAPTGSSVHLDSNIIESDGTGHGFSSMAPAQVAVGDQFTIKLTFLGGRGFSATNIDSGWLSVSDWNPKTNTPADGGPAEIVTQTGTLSFLDASGQAVYTSPSFSDDEGVFHIGQQFSTSTGLITFFGIQYSGILTAAIPGTTRTYNLLGLRLTGTNFSLVVPPPTATTPLPAALPLFAAALGGMGFLGCRRKRAGSLEKTG
jgi:hypothetical protein